MQRAVPPIEPRDAVLQKTSATSDRERSDIDPIKRRRVVTSQHARCQTGVPEIPGRDQDEFVAAVGERPRMLEGVEVRVPGSDQDNSLANGQRRAAWSAWLAWVSRSRTDGQMGPKSPLNALRA